MTYEYAQQNKAEINKMILEEAETIPSVNGLSNWLKEHGGICVSVIDGKIQNPDNSAGLDCYDCQKVGEEQYANRIKFGGISLSELIRDGRIKAAMIQM